MLHNTYFSFFRRQITKHFVLETGPWRTARAVRASEPARLPISWLSARDSCRGRKEQVR